MGIFNFFKKKKKTAVKADYSENEEIDFSELSPEERKKYAEAQCEIIRECKKFIDDAKNEYRAVGSYFSDIQIIETLPKETRDSITALAKDISELSVDRRMYMAEESRISAARYRQFSREENNIIDGIKKLQSDEAYLQVVKRDINALEGEKMSLRLSARELVERQRLIRKLSVISIFAFAVIFMIMIFAGFNTNADDSVAFLAILFLAALFVAADAAVYSRTIYDIKLTGKKLNKAVTLLNKVKIKLFNITNVIEYQYAKYGVKSSYELADQYQLYLEAKKIKEKYKAATIELNELEDKLLAILHGFSLFDADIWIKQAHALCEPKEMVEIRHEYSVRRQKLRKQIEESDLKVQDAKNVLKSIMSAYPSMSGEVMALIDRYKV